MHLWSEQRDWFAWVTIVTVATAVVLLLLFVDKVLHQSVANIIYVCQEHCTKLHCSVSRQSMRCVVRNFVWSVFEYVTIVCVWKNDDTLKQFFTRCRFVPFDPHCCGVGCANRAAVSLS